MKKNIFIVASIFTASVYAMEPENKWSITAYGTKINLHKGEMVKYYADDNEKEDVVICTGRTQQSAGGGLLCMYPLGKCNKMHGLDFNLHKDDKGYDVWQSLRLYGSRSVNDPGAVYARKGIYLLCIEEPWLKKADDGNCDYKRYYKKSDNEEHYLGHEAIEEYNEDLSLCYKILLNAGKEWREEVKNIAISMLGTGFKYWKNFIISKENIAPIAVEAILEYIKSALRAYNRIELFAEDDSDFNVYKEAFLQWKGRENVLLLYFAQKDPENIIALLPRELIHYIAKLI